MSPEKASLVWKEGHHRKEAVHKRWCMFPPEGVSRQCPHPEEVWSPSFYSLTSELVQLTLSTICQTVLRIDFNVVWQSSDSSPSILKVFKSNVQMSFPKFIAGWVLNLIKELGDVHSDNLSSIQWKPHTHWPHPLQDVDTATVCTPTPDGRESGWRLVHFTTTYWIPYFIRDLFPTITLSSHSTGVNGCSF